MTKRYDVNYFIEKFSKIPASKWTTYTFENYAGQCCALGHCGFQRNISGGKNKTTEGISLINLINKIGLNVVTINDGDTKYQQRSPKARILAALRDVKKQEAKRSKGAKQ